MMTVDELVLLALDNYRSRRTISYTEQTKIFVFYIYEIRNKGLSTELYLAYLKPAFKGWCHKTGIPDYEMKDLFRKVKTYLLQAEKRANKRAGRL
ncbi:hypothetical protein OLZ31_26170 [Enterobacter asburiae]|nr:hypothetical protein [Enterobacter asburiae]